MFVRHFTAGAGGRPRPVVHSFAALALYVGGRAEVEQRGRLRVEPGDVQLVPAGEAHRTITAAGAEVWGVGFEPGYFAGADQAGLLEPFERVRAGAAAVVSIPAGRQEHLRRMIAELHEESTRATGALQAHAQRSLLTLVLAEVARAAEPGPETGGPPLVAQALRYIERRCLAPISLRDVAAALGRSPAYVTTAMRVATGRTAQQWIVAARLAEARRRLLASDDTVESIADRVGGLDPTHFIRLFRREHGCTPAAWRAARQRPRV